MFSPNTHKKKQEQTKTTCPLTKNYVKQFNIQAASRVQTFLQNVEL